MSEPLREAGERQGESGLTRARPPGGAWARPSGLGARLAGGAAEALDELADDAAGTALRTFLEPVASALETARTDAIAPLLELQQSAAELATLLSTVARVAQETIGLYRDALERTVAAVAEADSVSEMVAVLAEESATLASSGDAVSVDGTLEDWRALGAEIAAAEAALL